MITKENILQWIDNPHFVDYADKTELKRLIDIYPYCEIFYWLYLRLLYVTGDLLFDSELLNYGVYFSDKKCFYEFLTYKFEEPEATEVSLETIAPPSDYFSFVEQEPENRESLQALAEKLRQARLARLARQTEENNPPVPKSSAPVSQPQPDIAAGESTDTVAQKQEPKTGENLDITEENARQLIKDKKYLPALEILRALNLNNPKKSAYFALQIKYIETIINNNNKKE